MANTRYITLVLGLFSLAWPGPPCGNCSAAAAEAVAKTAAQDSALLARLDAPLLFTKRHSYSGIHIYDTYYKWPPGGGGIYVIENPAAKRDEQKVRAIIDPTTEETLGLGVYNDPELSWDAKKLLFCFKGEPHGSTSIYEIGIHGEGLRRLTDPTEHLDRYKGSHSGQHDVTPAYLSDGRIVFLSTRPSGLVPCNNTGVAILHVMNNDGSDIHPISVNNVNEFDPSVLPDGRLLFGRWEYIDKNALTIQSLWTVNPDGTQETALFANNMVFPEAILDARPVPGSGLIVGTFSKHNSTPRGSIALVDPRRGKDSPGAISNLEHPDQPTHDLGNSCEPWPLSEEVVLFSGRPAGYKRNVIEIMDRAGHRLVVHSDEDICLHSPMLVKPRPRPPAIHETIDRQVATGRFYLQDIYQGLPGVKRGEVKWLRVIDETSRTSPRSGGSNPYNQTFLISSALAFSAKNFLGIVPVEEDRSAYFEVPSGRTIYFQALDGDGRLIQSMRSFMQAAPGTTRSCIGCHEHKYSTAANGSGMAEILGREPKRLTAESWGSGYLDYSSMVQPVLDEHCVSCHGGEKGIGAGMDLSGGWTEHFNISYENLTNRCETQLVAYWIAGIDCMNGTALWSSQIFSPRAHGSGAAPLAELLVDGHDGMIPELSRRQRDLLLAWIDTNGVYYGTWDTTPNGVAIRTWGNLRNSLVGEMQAAGCLRCHGESGRVSYFENDWINLEKPELSRILRAPLAEGEEGFGLGWCRQRKVDPSRQRIRLLWRGYAHAVQPPEAFPRREYVSADRDGEPVVSFSSIEDPHYKAMLAVIRQGRAQVLATPRVDMPGAAVDLGTCRLFIPPSVPDSPPPLSASADAEGVVRLSWQRCAETIGLSAEIHRGATADFQPNEDTLLASTKLFSYFDTTAPPGRRHYALILRSAQGRSTPSRAAVDVPSLPAPSAPVDFEARSAPGRIELRWRADGDAKCRFHVYRAAAGADEFVKLTAEPIVESAYSDSSAAEGVEYAYQVRAVSPRALESDPTPAAVAAAMAEIKEPLFLAAFKENADAMLHDGATARGTLHGAARVAGGSLTLQTGAYATFDHRPEFDLAARISVECWVYLDAGGRIPVVVSCGHWQTAGWFLQKLGQVWRWHVGGIDCDGGQPAPGRWIHLLGTFDGHTTCLFQDGKLVAKKDGTANRTPWTGPLHVGQYSGGPGPEFQVAGRIAGVKVYNRAVPAEDAAEASRTAPPAK